MPEIDQRFLTLHPATAVWRAQREKCEQCAHSYVPNSNDPKTEGHEGLRCRKTTPQNCFKRGGFKINDPTAYCIDARLEGAPCGPGAALFQPKD